MDQGQSQSLKTVTYETYQLDVEEPNSTSKETYFGKKIRIPMEVYVLPYMRKQYPIAAKIFGHYQAWSGLIQG